MNKQSLLEAIVKSHSSTPLSPRESEALLSILQGKTVQEVAKEKYLAPRTVDTHKSDAYAKLGIGFKGGDGMQPSTRILLWALDFALAAAEKQKGSIRPAYYRGASEVGKPILKTLGYDDRLLSMECRVAWDELGHDCCGALTHAVKYLWRAGDKGDLATDLQKAQFWLKEARLKRESADAATSWNSEEKWLAVAQFQRQFMPTVEAFDQALEMLGEALKAVK